MSASQARDIASRLEGFIAASKDLEARLNQERANNVRLKDQLTSSQQTYERLLEEARTQNRELELKNEKRTAALAVANEIEKKITERQQKIAEELYRYRASWDGVLQREREAKMILEDSRKNRERLHEFESHARAVEGELHAERKRTQQLDRHVKTYQEELQSNLVRLHSAEAKFKELTREIEAFRESRRSMDEEIAKSEVAIRERLHWESLREREETRASLEREFAGERERMRALISKLDASCRQNEERARKLENELAQERPRAQAAANSEQVPPHADLFFEPEIF